MQEANSINKSLSFLGRVIRTLSRKVTPGQPPVFVPYRDSQLTYLLKDSLGGNARTAVVANIHQNLRFACILSCATVCGWLAKFLEAI